MNYLAKLWIVLIAGLAGGICQAQTFESPYVISGVWGSMEVTNDTPAELGDPSIDGYGPYEPVWFQWTAPQSGVVTLDTIGSTINLSTEIIEGTNIIISPLGTEANDTVLGVYSGTNLTSLSQLAVNDDLFPISSSYAEEVVSGNPDYIQSLGEGPGTSAYVEYEPPFIGPSGLRFNAVGGQTYYFAVDSKYGTGVISLNWAYQPAGVFRFATEDEDPLSGLLLYQTSGRESEEPSGTSNAGNSTILTYYQYNAEGLLVTVTRVGGATGRQMVNYQTLDGTNFFGTNLLQFPSANGGGSLTGVVGLTGGIGLTDSNDVPAHPGIDYEAVSGTLVFDDFEMSKTILIPIVEETAVAGDQSNRVFGIQLYNPQPDPLETGTVSPPRVDPFFSTAMIRILNVNADPYGPDQVEEVTNMVSMGVTNSMTNLVQALYPTNAIFNFQKSNYRVPADVDNTANNGWAQVTIWVERFGTNTSAATINYSVNNLLGDGSGLDEEENNLFPLQPGSDYAVPTPVGAGNIEGSNSDFVLTAGTINFPAGNNNGAVYQPITFTVPLPTNGVTRFNKDFKIQLFRTVTVNNGPPQNVLVGMVNETTVTVLFNDQAPPAGSVDENYNADFNGELAVPPAQIPVTEPANDPNPGVGLFGEVYAVALYTNNEALIGGDFSSYNGAQQGSIALINTNGQLDPTFATGSGVNASVDAIALDGNQFVIGGSFSSYNGNSAKYLARVNLDGSFDPSFISGDNGPNNNVRAVAVEPNGEVLVGGDFTNISGYACNYVALLEPNGSVDPTFNVTAIQGPVYALAVQNGQVMVGGNFSVVGQTYQNIARLNADGSLDTTFAPSTGVNALVRALAWQTNGQVVVGGDFNSANAEPANFITRFNPSGSLDATNFFVGSGADSSVYSLVLQPDGTIYVGGSFSMINGTHRLGFARLYPDGILDTTFMDTAYNQFAGLKRIYSYDAPVIYAAAVQTDSNIVVGGNFNQVGGGQANADVCDSLDDELSLEYYGSVGYVADSFSDPYLYVEPHTRDGVRNRTGLARLFGGATAGPGNIGLFQNSFSVNKSQATYPISLLRTNGTLGPGTVNFSVQNGTANVGSDFTYDQDQPFFWIAWEFSSLTTRELSDGLWGESGFLQDPYGRYILNDNVYLNKLSELQIGVRKNAANPGNLNASFNLANPSDQDSFYLGGENIPLGTALGIPSAPMTFVDDTTYPGTVGFSANSYVVTNLLASIPVVRSNGITGVLSVHASTANGTALSGVDFVGTNETLIFGTHVVSNVTYVTIKADSYITNKEKTFSLSLSSLTGGAAYGITNATVRIVNPNFSGYITLATNIFGAPLSAGVLNFTINRVSGDLGTLTVQYATTNNTAISGINYLGATNTLTWNSGDVSPRVISIPLINPVTVASNLQFGVFLSNPTLNGTNDPALMSGSISNAALVITNDNSYGTLQFDEPTYMVNENGGYATLTVIRNGGGTGTVSVNYSTADGTALADATHGVVTNYIATNGVLIFGPNQIAASFQVPVLNDGIVDPANFYFTVSLSQPTNAILGALTNAPVNILDVQSYNQPPGNYDPTFVQAGINGSVYSLAQQANSQILVAGNFTAVGTTTEGYLARLNTDGTLDGAFLGGLPGSGNGGASGPVNSIVVQSDARILLGGSFTNVDGVTRNNIARVLTDGTLDTSFSPTGANGAVNAVAETFINGLRRVYVGGAFAIMNGTFSPGIARLDADIKDNINDGALDSSFSVGAGVDGVVNAIVVYPTNSIYAGKVIIGGLFQHYNGIEATNLVRLNIDGSLDTNFDNNLGLGPEGIVRAIAIQPDGNIMVGGSFTNFNGTSAPYIVRLQANGLVDPTFVGSANDLVEGIAVQPDNRILLVGQFSQADGVTRSHITRLLPTGAADPSINFGAGANGDVDTVLVQSTNTSIVIGGTFSDYDSQPVQNIARIYGGSETGSGQFEFTSANYTVHDAGSFADITIERTGGTSDGVYVNFYTTNLPAINAASNGLNYAAQNTNVYFPPGEVFESVTVPVFDDGVIETTNTVVGLALAGVPLGNQPTAILSIINDDSGVSFLTPPVYSVPKDVAGSLANIDIIRQGGTNSTATVNFFTTTNGTAQIGTDYTPVSQVVTFNPGVSDVQVQVPINNNNLPEGNQTVDLVLSNAVGATLLTPSNAVLTIIDTTPSPGRFAFSTNDYVVNKTAASANITIIRTNGTVGSVSVNMLVVPVTAVPGINYVAPPVNPVSVGFGNNQSSQTVSVPLIGNDLVQGTVTFSVILTNASGGAVLTASTNATVSIVNNVNTGVAFVNATNTASETNGSVVVIVQRVGALNNNFSVNYATTNGSAISGVNYSPVSGTLLFTTNELFQSISVPLSDRQITTNVAFGLTLSSATNALLVAPSNSVVVIQGSQAGLFLTNSAITVYKNSGILHIPVVCNNPGLEPAAGNTNVVPMTVNYLTADGTALAGQDYRAASGTLLFSNGVATNYINVLILNNSLITGTRVFTLSLTNATAPGRIIPPGSQTITIIDSNSGLSFSQPAYTALKNGGPALITVIRTDNTNSVSSVAYATANGTAVSNVDYYATNGVLTFTNGAVSNSFSVSLISSGTVQPDKSVLLQLFNPVNGFLVTPSAATLTIHDTSGSLVVPAGSTFVPGGNPDNNGLIDPGETVTLLFAFRAEGGNTVTDLLATLLPGIGVTPGGTTTQVYSNLFVDGPSQSRPFTFTASGTNGQQIAAAFAMQEVYGGVTNSLGTNLFSYALGTWTMSFTNPAAITIGPAQVNGSQPAMAAPYPSVITVSNVFGTVFGTTVTLTNLLHSSEYNVNALLVAPNASDILFLSHAGTPAVGVNGVTLTFSDSATNSLPNGQPFTNGVYKPAPGVTPPTFP